MLPRFRIRTPDLFLTWDKLHKTVHSVTPISYNDCDTTHLVITKQLAWRNNTRKVPITVPGQTLVLQLTVQFHGIDRRPVEVATKQR